MKILAFTDFHGDSKDLKVLEEKADLADILVCAGDFTIFEDGIDRILSKLNSFNKEVLIIHGNHESFETLYEFCKVHNNITCLHNSYFIKDDVLFMGWGGGGFSHTSSEFEKKKYFFKNLVNYNKDKAVVLVTHAPPFDTAADEIYGEHCGNKSFSNFILENKVDLALCGHLHENDKKQSKLGESTVLNPGGDGVIVDL